MQIQAIQLIKDFTTECVNGEVEIYMGMVMEEEQMFKGLINHIKSTFKSGEMISELISNFYGQTQKKNESEYVFVDKTPNLCPENYHLENNIQGRT